MIEVCDMQRVPNGERVEYVGEEISLERWIRVSSEKVC